MWSMPMHKRKLFTRVTNQQMHFYKHVQSRIISLQQHVSVTPATITSVSYNKNTVNTQMIVKH